MTRPGRFIFSFQFPAKGDDLHFMKTATQEIENSIDPGKGYRLLKPSEVIGPDAEYRSFDGQWLPNPRPDVSRKFVPGQVPYRIKI